MILNKYISITILNNILISIYSQRFGASSLGKSKTVLNRGGPGEHRDDKTFVQEFNITLKQRQNTGI